MRSTVELSLPQSRTVRGYEMRRLPIGAFLRALDALEHAPDTLMAACFPGMSAAQAWAQLRTLDAQALLGALMRAAAAAPREAVRLISALTGAPEEALIEDPAVGLDGLAEMLLALWELNRMENFIKAARALTDRARAALDGRDGCSG